MKLNLEVCKVGSELDKVDLTRDSSSPADTNTCRTSRSRLRPSATAESGCPIPLRPAAIFLTASRVTYIFPGRVTGRMILRRQEDSK